MIFEPVGRNRYFNIMLKEEKTYMSNISINSSSRELLNIRTFTNENIEIDNLRYIPITAQSVYKDLINNLDKKIVYSYETRNPKQKGILLKEEDIQGKFRKKTEYSNFDNEHKGIVEFLSKTKTTTYTKEGENIVYRTDYSYDDKYRIIEQTEFANLTEKVITNFEYYPSGNIKQTSVKVADIPTQITRYEYDRLFRLPTKRINALGQYRETIYSYLTGKILSDTDIDGSKTTYTYNIAGQLTRKRLPNGQTINYKIAYTTQHNAKYKITKTTDVPYMETVTYYDIFDREVYQTQTGANGELLHSENIYDYKNRLIRRYNWHTEGQSAIPYTAYQYDIYDRITEKQVFDGLIINSIDYNYSGRTTTTKDAFDNKFISGTTLNEIGLVETQQDRGGTISYIYNAEGNPTKIIANGANCIEFKYIPNDKNPQKKYIKDFLFVNDSLLSSVRIKQGGVFVDKYMFNYEVSNTFNRLVSVDYYTYNPPLVVNSKPDIDITKPDTPISSPIIVTENPVLLSTTHVSWGENATLQNVEVESDFVPDYDRMYIGDIDGDESKDYVFLNYKKNGRDNYLNIKYKKSHSLQKIPFGIYKHKNPMVLIQDIDLDGQNEVVLLYEKAYMHNIEFPNGELHEDYDIYCEQHTSYEKHLKLFALNYLVII